MARPTTTNEIKKRKNGPVPVTPIAPDNRPPLPPSISPEDQAAIRAAGRATFKRLASGRVNAIIARLNTLAKMASGKTKYGYTDEDIELIRKTLVGAVNTTCDRLRRKPPVKGGFSFDRPDAGA